MRRCFSPARRRRPMPVCARSAMLRRMTALAPACPTCAPARPLAPPDQRPQVTSPEEAYAIVRPLLEGRDREHCLLISLDVKHRVLGVATISIGSVDHTFMAPREIFREALLAGASAVFLAHNHPSGDPTPSSDDRQMTRRLAQAGQTLGVDVLDHLVVGNPAWVSLARLGVI
ncbi:MAG: DNA repair protein RadC [Nitriliruptorales bacterium]|nr:DNA repair protein RadC [Nitriliruptorales bacterium]